MYRSVLQPSIAEITVKHSKFIAFCASVSSEDDAEDFVRTVKKKYPDATHAPYAYVSGEKGEKCRASDDGEPSGTSGAPILETIKKQGLTFTAVVVVRYFGGIKLGTGGLARAYAAAAEESIRSSGSQTFEKCAIYRIQCDYAFLSSVQNKVFSFQGKVLSSDFASGALLTVAVPLSRIDSFLSAVLDVTSGKASLCFSEEKYCPIE